MLSTTIKTMLDRVRPHKVMMSTHIRAIPMLLATMRLAKVCSYYFFLPSFLSCSSWCRPHWCCSVHCWQQLSCEWKSNQNFLGSSRNTSPTTVHSSDDLSDCQARDNSVDSGYGTLYLIKVRGLPWTTTKKDLRDFFSKVNISHGLDGIHFITDDENNFGVAYIQLPTRQDYEIAQTFHRKKLDERYIDGKTFFAFRCLFLSLSLYLNRWFILGVGLKRILNSR